MMLREGMFLADRYEIIEQIGTGGMADVYKAKCHKLNRYVAIKVMKSEFSQDKTFVSKFWAEAWNLVECTYDLHSDERLNEGNVMTEYEKKFSDMGNPICKLIADR